MVHSVPTLRASDLLKGNHEEVFLQAAKGDVQATRFLFRFGGRETMFSYGLSEAELDQLDFEELTDWLLNHVPRAHVDFLDGFEDMKIERASCRERVCQYV